MSDFFARLRKELEAADRIEKLEQEVEQLHELVAYKEAQIMKERKRRSKAEKKVERLLEGALEFEKERANGLARELEELRK